MSAETQKSKKSLEEISAIARKAADTRRQRNPEWGRKTEFGSSANVPARSQITEGAPVSIVTKENQSTGKLTEGTVEDILTSSESHPHGIMVRLGDGQVGRVKKVLSQEAATRSGFVDLDKKEIPKVEDAENEFKEFYQYDEKFGSPDITKQTIDEISKSVRRRFAEAVCSFGNSSTGGFVYLGVNSDGQIAGLERDLKFGSFSDYEDVFANNIQNRLEELLKDRAFIVSKLKIKFREIDKKTICIIQVLPSNQPLFLYIPKEIFCIRGPTPRAERMTGKNMIRYIRDRFPDYH